MIGKMISKKMFTAIGMVSIMVCIAIYSYYSWRQHKIEPNDTTMPNLVQLKDGVVKIFEADRKGERWISVDTKATVIRLFCGMLSGTLLAFVVGVMMGCFPVVEAFFIWPLSFFAKIPPTAALSIFFVMYGTGWQLFIAMVTFGIMPSLAQSIYLAVRRVPMEMIDKTRTLGGSKCELIWNVVIRYIMPEVIDAVRLQIGPAVVYLIAAEMLLAQEGFGYRIRLEFKKSNMDVVFPYLALLGLSTLALDGGMRRVQKFGCKWYSQERS